MNIEAYLNYMDFTQDFTMAFSKEAQMIPVIRDNIKAVISKSSLAIANELPVNNRIVDITLAALRPGFANRLLDPELIKAFRRTSLIELDILGLIKLHSPTSLHRISKALALDIQSTRQKYIDSLSKSGLITQTSKFCYSLGDWQEILPLYLLSIEAKRNKWKEAIEQAAHNQLFSDYSFVAVDSETLTNRNIIIKECHQKNVGLISVFENNAIEIVNFPSKNTMLSKRDSNLQKIRVIRDLASNKSKWAIQN